MKKIKENFWSSETWGGILLLAPLVLILILLVLKLTNVIANWNWLIVFSPILLWVLMFWAVAKAWKNGWKNG